MEETAQNPGKMGRPRKPIDWEQIAEMCRIHCTPEEIAGVCRVSRSTLDARCQESHGMSFQQFYADNASDGKMSLRRAQWSSALDDRNVTMMRWLGINQLGQSDKQETTTNINVSGFEVLPEQDSQE